MNNAATKNHDIARTAWAQISIGTKMACGARNATVDGNVLTFQVLSKPMHYVRVTLDASDTYTVEFFRIKRGSYAKVVIEDASDVYADQLSEVIYHQVNK